MMFDVCIVGLSLGPKATRSSTFGWSPISGHTCSNLQRRSGFHCHISSHSKWFFLLYIYISTGNHPGPIKKHWPRLSPQSRMTGSKWRLYLPPTSCHCFLLHLSHDLVRPCDESWHGKHIETHQSWESPAKAYVCAYARVCLHTWCICERNAAVSVCVWCLLETNIPQRKCQGSRATPECDEWAKLGGWFDSKKCTCHAEVSSGLVSSMLGTVKSMHHTCNSWTLKITELIWPDRAWKYGEPCSSTENGAGCHDGENWKHYAWHDSATCSFVHHSRHSMMPEKCSVTDNEQAMFLLKAMTFVWVWTGRERAYNKLAGEPQRPIASDLKIWHPLRHRNKLLLSGSAVLPSDIKNTQRSMAHLTMSCIHRKKK